MHLYWCLCLDIFLSLSLKDHTTFWKLAVLPLSGEKPNQLDPLEKANLSANDPAD
jgi:hypothetical protein